MRVPFDAPATNGRQFIELTREIATAILRTVEAGWTLASQSPDINADAGEVAMTERLREGMRSALHSGQFSWGRTMVVLLGTESRSRPEVLFPDGRTDIPIMLIEIFFQFREHDPHAIIECKRLAGTDSRLCREYVVEGIDRFQTGKYASNHSTGFMVGYLVAGSATDAVTGINRYLNGKRRLNEELNRSNLIDEPWVRKSRHPRSGNLSIEIHHAFLEIA